MIKQVSLKPVNLNSVIDNSNNDIKNSNISINYQSYDRKFPDAGLLRVYFTGRIDQAYKELPEIAAKVIDHLCGFEYKSFIGKIKIFNQAMKKEEDVFVLIDNSLKKASGQIKLINESGDEVGYSSLEKITNNNKVIPDIGDNENCFRIKFMQNEKEDQYKGIGQALHRIHVALAEKLGIKGITLESLSTAVDRHKSFGFEFSGKKDKNNWEIMYLPQKRIREVLEEFRHNPVLFDDVRI